jgi:hypothetical protein
MDGMYSTHVENEKCLQTFVRKFKGENSLRIHRRNDDTKIIPREVYCGLNSSNPE